MCGICGILHFDQEKEVDKNKLIDMRDILRHRGPDDADIFIEKNIGLGHRRLSIIDLSEKGKQPFYSDDGRYVLVFNGEIYNFNELKNKHLSGHSTFQSKTDTEILLQLYLILGKKVLDELNGMFAFAIWDKKDKSLFIARDRFGIKPLYYSLTDSTLYFASEQKAILKAGVDKSVDEKIFTELLLFRYVSGEKTIFKNIKKLLPGHWLEIKQGQVKFQEWWSLAENRSQLSGAQIESDPIGWFKETFDSSIKYRMISDVPVGILLSGGLDSSSVVASAGCQNFSDLKTFTVGFKKEGFDESPIAKEVAEYFNYQFHQLKLSGENLLNSLTEATWHLDEPLTHQNDPHLLAISKYAKNHVTVLLSGEGSDEMLGGYVRYKPLKKLYRFKKAISGVSSLAASFSNNSRVEKLHRYFSNGDGISSLVLLNSSNLYPKDLNQYGIKTIENGYDYRYEKIKEAAQLFPNEPARQAMYLDQYTFMSSLLDRNDKMTMGASIECRVPFIDHRIAEGAAQLNSNWLLKGNKGKYVLFQLAKERLPASVTKFKKWGFGVPWAEYFRKENTFRDWIDSFANNPFLDIGILKYLDKKSILKGFMERGENEILFRQLFMIHVWSVVYYDEF